MQDNSACRTFALRTCSSQIIARRNLPRATANLCQSSALPLPSTHHESHAGNSAQFAAAGVPLIAQKNTKPRLPAGPATVSSTAAGKAPAPTVAYDRDYKLRMGGVEVQLLHFGNACTNGDTLVHFPDLKVVAVGDLFTADAPAPDYSAGGSLVGWGPVIAQILKLDFDVVVPGKGPMATRAELEAFKTKIDTLVHGPRQFCGLCRRLPGHACIDSSCSRTTRHQEFLRRPAQEENRRSRGATLARVAAGSHESARTDLSSVFGGAHRVHDNRPSTPYADHPRPHNAATATERSFEVVNAT